MKPTQIWLQYNKERSLPVLGSTVCHKQPPHTDYQPVVAVPREQWEAMQAVVKVARSPSIHLKGMRTALAALDAAGGGGS